MPPPTSSPRPTGRRGAAVCFLLLIAGSSLAEGQQPRPLPLEMEGQGPMVLPLRRKLRPDGEVRC